MMAGKINADFQYGRSDVHILSDKPMICKIDNYRQLTWHSALMGSVKDWLDQYQDNVKEWDNYLVMAPVIWASTQVHDVTIR